MVICKYYQQGTCKFGSTCRFDHPRSDYGGAGESVLRGRFGAHQGPHQYTTNNYYHGHGKTTGPYKVSNNSHDFEEVMRMVIQEVVQSEKGGQWPLSCFAPIKERPCFPGWEDYSPEEIRWKMYEALQNGTLPECQRQIKELYDAAKLRRHYILNPNSEVFKIIEKLLRGQKIETETSFSFLQAATQKRNNFVSWHSSSFGINQQQSPVSNNFVFALPHLGSSTGQTTVQQQPSGLGGTVQTIQSVNVPPASVFRSSTEIQPPFGNVVQDSAKFQGSSLTAVSSNVFGTNKGPINSTSGSNKLDNNVTDNFLYTSKAELTQDEVNAFMAQTFTMGKVPTKPPPKDLCTL